MRAYRSAFLAACAVLVPALLASFAFAEQATYTLGNITITAKGPAPHTTARTIITAPEIAASGATTLGSVLEQTAAVDITQSGPTDSVTSPSIRGATANEVLVLIDGVPANNPLTGAVDLSTIPLNQIREIDIIRGSAAAIYGPSAVGGVIDIITKSSASSPLSVTLENGSFRPGAHLTGAGPTQSTAGPDYTALADSQRLSLEGGTTLGDVSLTATGEVKRAGNDYLYRDSNGEWRQLQNAALFATNGSLAVTAPGPGGSLSMFANAAYQSHGDPGPVSFPSPNAHETDLAAGDTFRYHTDTFFSDLLNLSLAAHAGYSQVAYNDPDSGTVSDHRLWTVSSSVAQKAHVSDALTLGYGFSGAFNAVNSTDVGRRLRLDGGAYFAPELTLGRLSVRPSVRYDYLSDMRAGAVSAQLDVAERLSQSLSLTANAARSVRFPTLDDLYWPAGPYTAGNPSLGPETAWSANLGLTLTQGMLSYDLSAYARYTQNIILWEQGVDGVYRPTNYGLGLYPGIEQQLSLALPGHYAVRLAYSFLYSFALSGGLTIADNTRMPMTPVHTVSAVVEHTAAPLTWSVSGRFESPRLWTDSTTLLPAFFVVNAHLKWQADPHWSPYLTVRNLFGEQYQTDLGFPMPPAELRIGVIASL